MVRIAFFLITTLAMATTTGAAAMTMKECGVKYQEAQKAGTLGGLSWNAYRTQNCAGGTDAQAAATPAPGNTSAAPAVDAGSKAVFPSAVDPKYSSETAAKARRLTCLDQYRANKATGGNSDLKWIQKGGGYFSACNKRLRA